MNALISIGAGKSQYPVISKAKKLGYNIISIDKDSKAPGFSISDERLIKSTFHPKQLINPILELSKKYNINGILNRSSGPPVVTAAELSKVLDIPAYPSEMAKIIINKHKLMEHCLLNKIPCPSSYSFSGVSQLEKTKLQYPCVVKPSLSLIGKDGITIVANKKQLFIAALRALEASHNKIALVGEYIYGTDFSLFSFVDKGKLVPICLLDELNGEKQTGQLFGKGFAMPSIFSGTIVEKRVHEIARKIIDVFGIFRSPLIISFRSQQDDYPKLIEIHLDLGGDLLIERLFPIGLNIDFLSFAIKLLAGENITSHKVRVKPSAIFYQPGDGLNSDRPNIVLKAKNNEELKSKIDKVVYS